MSRRPFRLALAALAMALVAAAPALAQDEKKEDEWQTKWSNGFSVSKGDSFSLKFGGRIQADYTFASADDEVEAALGAANFEDGFEFRRARLFFEGTIYDRVELKAQYDFAAEGDPTFKDVWIGLQHGGDGIVQFGHFKEPFSLEEITSSKYLAFLERSLPVEAFAPRRNSGIGVNGASGDTLNWGVGAFYEADDFAVSAHEDRINLTGRVGFRPIYEDKGRRMVHLGLAVTDKQVEDGGSLRFRARPEAHFTTRMIDTGNFAADSALILGGEVAGVMDRFWFAAEYMLNDVDAPAVGDPTFSGYYAQAGFYLTDDYRRFKPGEGAFDRQKPSGNWDASGGPGAWEIVARFSSLDLTDQGIVGGEQDDITLGVNWYLNPATRLMLNLVHADADGLGEADFFLMRWQVDF
jgi:phosphate-selective porin OprO/OprP